MAVHRNTSLPACQTSPSRSQRSGAAWWWLAPVALATLAACGPRGSHPASGAGGGGSPDAHFTIHFPEGGARICVEKTEFLPATLKPADVLILFDRSGSMNSAFGAGTRYSIEAGIIKTLLPVYQDKIRFGYGQFPAKGSCPAGYVMNCCADRPSVPIGLLTAGGVAAAVAAAVPVEGNTPTAEALRYAREYYESLTDGVPDRYVLLSTDGRPSCTADGKLGDLGGDGQIGTLNSGPCADALGEVEKLVQAGVKVIVLGVGPGLATDPGGDPGCLAALAKNGGMPRPGVGPAFYTGEDSPALERAFQEIFGGIVQPSCTIELKAEPTDPYRLGVFLDGKQIPRDAKDGWDFEAPASFKKIHINGVYCQRLQRFQVGSVEVRVGCAPCRDVANCE